ncbi:MAG TPA: DHHA1 domain-containing protein [Candidatus Acidoferrales bacterium]
MTERLYYRDSFQKEFEANVVSCERDGERWKVILDRTAFYPSSGGQPHDTGRLGAAEVLEVVDDLHDPTGAAKNATGADTHDEIVHYTSAELPPGPVVGKIDWPRRIDHMQQHTAQHLLSAAFVELFGFQTKSFHLGTVTSSIDIEAPSIQPKHLEAAERRTNEIIFEDREVLVRFGSAQELAEAGIRKTVERQGVLRAIDIAEFDRQPCGGTHLARTGQAGLLLIRKLERRRDLWRIEYVAGYRALNAARSDFATLTQAAAVLTCALADVPAGISKWQEERRAAQSGAKKMEDRLAQLEARDLLAQHGARSAPAEPNGPFVIAVVLEEASANYLGLLAAKLVAESKVVALLASRAGGHVVFAQTPGALPPTADLGSLLRESIQKYGGKGGGNRNFAQGSLPNPADAPAALEQTEHLLSGS